MIIPSKGFWDWQLLASSIILGGALAFSGSSTKAQIVPDTTLGAESSVITPQAPDSPIDVIQGGAKRGANLFHSFEQFSVTTGGTAYFNNPLNIQNIFSRVTGESISNIDGLLGANGTANLFLLNPNGIIFGPNASLNIGGSFLGSTASSLNFADGTQFSATAPQTTPLLTVSVPLGLQFGGTVGGIQVQGSALQVQTGQTLALIGGDVSVEGRESGFLKALGGRVELGGLAGVGTVDIEGQQSEGAFRLMSLRFSDLIERGDVLLNNGALVDVAAGGGGSIAINARNLEVLGGDFGGSLLRAGIESRMGSPEATAGDITLNATGEINVADSSIRNDVRTEGVGIGGDINIMTGSLSVTNGTQLAAVTRGQGDAGSVRITARDTVSFDGVNSDGFPSGAFSSVAEKGVGIGGDINIMTGSLSVTNGAQLAAATRGQGDAGSVFVQADELVSLAGNNTSIFSSVEERAFGNGGDINITTESLSVTNGAQLGSATESQGDAGSITINARDTVSFDGVGSNENSSAALSNVQPSGVGRGGNINITAGSLSLTGGAQLVGATQGKGSAGTLTIEARDTIFLDGTGSNGTSSGLFNIVADKGVGNGGDIIVKTGLLSVTNSAVLNASTYGQGDAGSVTIIARDTVSFDGVSNGLSSAAGSMVGEGAVGNGGDINITTESLSVTNGAQLGAGTEGQGNAGSVTIIARDTVSFDGIGSDGAPSGAFSTVEEEAVGNGSGINITTEKLSLTDGAVLNASSRGSGAAGNIEVAAGSIRLDNQALLSSDTAAGQGNITLRSQDLVLRRGSNITTDATGTASGGNINIDTGVIAALEDSDITANADEAFGGQVMINAQGIFGTEFRNQPTSESDITASSNLGPQFSGTVEINTSNVDLSQGLVTLPVELINVEGLIANSCIARSSKQRSSFNITGAGGLPTRPGDAAVSPYPTGTVRSIPNSGGAPSSSQTSPVPSTTKAHPWKMGDPIVEPQGVYRLANGELVLSRECSD